MYRYILLILISIKVSPAQDTINFRLFDSLKTRTEDRHKSIIAAKDPDNIDVKIFRSINNSQTNFKDAVLPYIDRSAPPLGFILPITSIAIGRFNKNYYDENTGFLLGVSEGLNLIMTFGLKMTVNRKRPFKSLQHVYYNSNTGTDPYSFPSGHTSISFAISSMYNLRYPKYPQIYIPMYVYSLLVAYCRPYFGMHYPSDLLAGALIGSGSSIIIYSLRSELLKFKNRLLSENMEDNGSINGKNLAVFGAALAASSLLGQLLQEHNNKINIDFSPYGKNNEMFNFNINFRF